MAERNDDDDTVMDPVKREDGVYETEDGVELELDEEDDARHDPQADPGFYINLAAKMKQTELDEIAAKLMELTDADKESRKQRQEDYSTALRSMGVGSLKNMSVDDKAFKQASTVTHPMTLKAAVDFQALSIRELWPVGGQDGGPVKQQVIGKQTQQKLDRATRKSKFMNWQLTKQMPSFRASLEELLGQLPPGGAQYLKISHDWTRGRLQETFVPIDHIWIPSAAPGFEGAERHTHWYEVTGDEFDRRVASNMYIAIPESTDQEPEQTSPDETSNRVVGKERSALNVDKIRGIREIYCHYNIESDAEVNGGKATPYIITIEEAGQKITGVYRNWMSNDPNKEEIKHIVEFPFIYWREGCIGLDHLIGCLADAATGALRAMLDSALLSTLPTGARLKGVSGSGGQTVDFNPGEFAEIESAAGGDPDIRKALMMTPFPQPSVVLFQLLGFLSDAGQQMIMSSLETLAEGHPQMPVGTTMALFEQGSKVYSAIHARLHFAMERVLKVVHNLNALWLDDDQTKREAGEILAKREDFIGAMDVIPVSDPNIFSEVQRWKQVEFMSGRAMQLPMLYDLRAIEEEALKQARIPDGAKRFLLPKPEPKKLNSVNENVSASMGQPIVVFPDQDHAAHLRDHIYFLKHPLFGTNPAIRNILLPQMVPHIKDHMVFLYLKTVVDLSSELAGKPISDLMDEHDDVANPMDLLLSDVSGKMTAMAGMMIEQTMPDEESEQLFVQAASSPVVAFMDSLMKELSAMAPPQPMDPSAAAVHKTNEDSKAKQQQIASNENIKTAEMALKGKDLALREQEVMAKNEQTKVEFMEETRLEHVRLAQEGGDHDADRAAKVAMNTADNVTAASIASAEIESGEKVAVSTGTGINPGS